MTKAEQVMRVVNKVYSFIGAFTIIQGLVNIKNQITVDFMGTFEGKPVKITVACRNRNQVAYLLRRFRRDEKGLLGWVKFVVISNVRSKYIRNGKGKWSMRRRVLELRIRRRAEQEKPTPSISPTNGGMTEKIEGKAGKEVVLQENGIKATIVGIAEKIEEMEEIVGEVMKKEGATIVEFYSRLLIRTLAKEINRSRRRVLEKPEFWVDEKERSERNVA